MISDITRQALLSSDSSRRNKLWRAVWLRDQGEFIEWEWQGKPYRSRLRFRFSHDEQFVQAKSFEEDVLPTYTMIGRIEVWS